MEPKLTCNVTGNNTFPIVVDYSVPILICEWTNKKDTFPIVHDCSDGDGDYAAAEEFCFHTNFFEPLSDRQRIFPKKRNWEEVSVASYYFALLLNSLLKIFRLEAMTADKDEFKQNYEHYFVGDSMKCSVLVSRNTSMYIDPKTGFKHWLAPRAITYDRHSVTWTALRDNDEVEIVLL